MLRPNFVRTQIGDVEMFEKHVEHLIQAIPNDGSSFYLRDLFFQLSLDVATDLLFGQSTNTLAPGFADTAVKDFVDAYCYCLTSLDGSGRGEEKDGYVAFAWEFLGMFLPNPKFKQKVEVVNSMLVQLFEAGLICLQATLDPNDWLTFSRLC